MEKHEHSHSKRRRSRKRSSNKLVRFLVENKFHVLGVALLAVLLIFLVVMMLLDGGNGKDDPYLSNSGGQVTTPTQQKREGLVLQIPWIDHEVSLIGDAAQALLDADVSIAADRILDPFRAEKKDLDQALPMELTFDVISVPPKQKVLSFQVDVWKTGDADTKQSYELGADARGVELTCLETGVEYQYRIQVRLTGGSAQGAWGSFRTAASPRILTIDGIRNVRDMGGWQTTDGKTIRQGLLFRGPELDGAVKEEFKVTEAGKQDMLSKLGIRTDLDLRASNEGFNALGASVHHSYFEVISYGGIFTEEGKEPVRKVFETLADPEIYPAYIHCTHGADRTGTICYLLGAVLGVSEEDLMREYELSALTFDAIDRDLIEPMISRLEEMGGKDMKENAELYLKSVGVTQEQIDAIRRIYLQ